MSRDADRWVLTAALAAVVVGALLVAWPRSDAEVSVSNVAIGKAPDPLPSITYAALALRPGQAVGAVLVVLGLGAVAFLLGRRVGATRWGRVVLGVGVGLVVVGVALFVTAPPATSANVVVRAMGLPDLATTYDGLTWSAGQVIGLVVGTIGVLAGALGFGTIRVRGHARRV